MRNYCRNFGWVSVLISLNGILGIRDEKSPEAEISYTGHHALSRVPCSKTSRTATETYQGVVRIRDENKDMTEGRLVGQLLVGGPASPLV